MASNFIDFESAFSNIRVLRPESNLIVLETSRWYYIVAVLALLTFISFWYGLLIFKQGPDKPIFILLFYLAPLFTIPNIIQNIAKIIRPLKLTFNIFSKTILSTHDIDREVPFHDVQHIQIRDIPFNSGHEFRVSLLLKDGNKLSVFRTTENNRASKIADQLADILKADIKAE